MNHGLSDVARPENSLLAKQNRRMANRLIDSTTRRQAFRLVALSLLLATVASGIYYYWKPSPLNVILITFDTTRADHIGIYGYEQGLTRVFDDFARQGVTFDRAYATAPLTLPSHATMLTGLYPPEHGLRVNGDGRLAGEIPVLPEILRQHGYDTGAFVAAFVLDSKFGLERGFETYDDDLSETSFAAHSVDRHRDGKTVVNRALDWLRQRTFRPFFCWIHLYDAHGEYDARPDLFGSKFEKQPYDAGIAVEVQQLERVLKFLKEQKLDQKTIVVVAGDHGEGLDDHDEFEHGMLVYNTTLHVPLVVVGPRDCQPGHRVAEPVSLVDLTPTLLDLLRLPSPKHVSGRSLRTAMTGGTLSPRPCYAETEGPFLENHWCPLHTVISDRWKYIHTTRPELYDLQKDPGETHDLAGSATDQSREMRTILEIIQEQLVPARAQNLTLSQKDLATLATLGYTAGAQSADSTKSEEVETLPDMKDMLPQLMKIQKARRLYHQGQYAETADLARTVVAATNQFPLAEVLLGDALSQQGQLDEATAIYRSLLERHLDCAKAHSHLGNIYVRQRQWEQAVTEYRAAIALASEGSQVHFDLAQTLMQLQKFDEALQEYRESIRTDPGFVLAHFQLGLLFAKSQRPKEAIACFEQTIKYDPQFAMAHSNLASMYSQLGQSDKATEHAEKAVELDPRSFEARFNLGTILTLRKRYDEGIGQFREALNLRPDDPRPLQRIREIEAVQQRSIR